MRPAPHELVPVRRLWCSRKSKRYQFSRTCRTQPSILACCAPFSWRVPLRASLSVSLTRRGRKRDSRTFLAVQAVKPNSYLAARLYLNALNKPAFCEILHALGNTTRKVSFGIAPVFIRKSHALCNISKAFKLVAHPLNKACNLVCKLLRVMGNARALSVGSGTIAGHLAKHVVHKFVGYLTRVGKLQNLAHALNVFVLANRTIALEVVTNNLLHVIRDVLAIVSHSVPLSVVAPAFWGRWFLRLAGGFSAWQLLLSIFSGLGQLLFLFTFSTHLIETFK